MQVTCASYWVGEKYGSLVSLSERTHEDSTQNRTDQIRSDQKGPEDQKELQERTP
jgi:hypothetical protein